MSADNNYGNPHAEIEEFYCEGCRAWLREGGIVHDDGEHDGAQPTSRYRYSCDGGATWQSEPRDEFNQALREWLNDRDYVSGDWPDNVPEVVRSDADEAFGNGAILDENGWPIPAKDDTTRVGMGKHISPKYPEPNTKVFT